MSASRPAPQQRRPTVELFVWYRCAPAQAVQVGGAARSLLARMAADCGVRGRLLQRDDGELTWMEHYQLEDQAGRLQALLDAMARHWPAALPERHVEHFTELAFGDPR